MQIYIYPIKSLRGISVPRASFTRKGLAIGNAHDRRFMILKVANSDTKATSSSATDKLKNMYLSNYPQMALFHTALDHASDPTKIIVTYSPPGSCGEEAKTVSIPLLPDVSHLASLEICMHNSPTCAYDMGATYNDWFSACFGYRVILPY